MLKSGAAIALVGALACAACVEDDAAVSPYAANYKPLVTPTAAEKFAGEPQLRSSLGSSADDTLAMFTLGYANVGWASYQGQADDPEAALDQARAIGAAYVVISRDDAGAGHLYVPAGPVNPSAVDVRARGEVLVHDVPTRLYAYTALFFAPLPKQGAGIFYRDLTPAQARTGAGVMIAAVRMESPAARAGVQPGEVIEQVDGHAVRSSAAVRALGPLKSNACLSLRRGADRRNVCLTAPAGWR